MVGRAVCAPRSFFAGGGLADFVARYTLTKLGLNPGKDVTMKILATWANFSAKTRGLSPFG